MPQVEIPVFEIAAERFITTLAAQNDGHSILSRFLHNVPLGKNTSATERLILMKEDALNGGPEGTRIRESGMPLGRESGNNHRDVLAFIKFLLGEAGRKCLEPRIGRPLSRLANDGGRIDPAAQTEPHRHVAAQTQLHRVLE